MLLQGARVVECSCCTMCQASIAMKMQHLRYRFFDLIYGINFWEGSIKAVEGLFGTGVGSYFRFLKVNNSSRVILYFDPYRFRFKQ